MTTSAQTRTNGLPLMYDLAFIWNRAMWFQREAIYAGAHTLRNHMTSDIPQLFHT